MFGLFLSPLCFDASSGFPTVSLFWCYGAKRSILGKGSRSKADALHV